MYIATYPWLHFWQWIAYIFEHFFFVPIDGLRHWQDQTWWGANIVNWIFILIIAALFIYWLFKLKIFHDHDKENTPETHR